MESAASAGAPAGANAADPYAASVSAALSELNITPGAEGGGPNTSTSTMNNGQKDTTHSDVQKLQEQLNDIKEQVQILFMNFFKKKTRQSRVKSYFYGLFALLF